MKLFYNNKPEYGDSGPFEAESKEELADLMHDDFEMWAIEIWDVFCEKLKNHEIFIDIAGDWIWDNMRYKPRENPDDLKSVFIENEYERMRIDYIEGLDEI